MSLRMAGGQPWEDGKCPGYTEWPEGEDEGAWCQGPGAGASGVERAVIAVTVMPEKSTDKSEKR